MLNHRAITPRVVRNAARKLASTVLIHRARTAWHEVSPVVLTANMSRQERRHAFLTALGKDPD